MYGKRNKGTPGLYHPFAPVFDARSKVLVLGSFPSVKSRENAFYYGHPQNRFWRVLAALFQENTPGTIAEKTVLLHKHHIALWDVVASCTVDGSADSTLKPLRFNDILAFLKKTEIDRIFANGQKAGRLYQVHLEKETGVPIHILPSTSPANAAWSLKRLTEAWKPLKDAAENPAKKT
ncbi:MAG: DNA-deoxyinosine glycosylase [Clostridiales bacterium]|nr:DNA-deoxyinosine glycosylase [Clostridiales bacterium]